MVASGDKYHRDRRGRRNAIHAKHACSPIAWQQTIDHQVSKYGCQQEGELFLNSISNEIKSSDIMR